jgi:MFS family permease
MRQVPKKLLPLFLIILFDQTSVSLMFPVLTFVFFDQSSSLFSGDTTHATRSLLYGLCISLANLSCIIIAPLLSLFSDNYGRRKMLLLAILSALICAACSAISILLSIVPLLLIAKFISGCGARSVTNPIAQAIVGDLVDKENKVIHMGYLQFIISLGAFAGPLLGGYFVKSFFFPQLNFSLPFLIAAGFSSIAILFTYLFFAETFNSKNNNLLQLKQIIALLRKPAVLQISALLLLMQISWSMYYQFIPPVLKIEFQFSPTVIGWFVGLIAFWLALAATFGLRILKKFYQERQIVYYASCLIFIGFCAVFIAALFPVSLLTKVLLWLSGALVPIGDVLGYCAITTLYSNAVSAEDQGKVMGLCFVIVAITWAVTALAGGALAALHISLPLLCAPCGIIVLLFLNRKIIKTKAS